MSINDELWDAIQKAGIGVKHSGRWLAFRVGPSQRVQIHGFLS
jgi:hypothetical protein